MKIIITGSNNIDKLSLAKNLVKENDGLSITPLFSTDEKYKGKINDNYIYYLNPNVVSLSYKNNAFLSVITKDYKTEGITADDFYNNNILSVNLELFNNITDNIFINEDILVIWTDTKKHNNNIINELKETKYLMERLNNNNLKINYLYFLDEDFKSITRIVLLYLNNPDKRKEILKEYC